MQYILSEEEIREFHALQLENEELRTELAKQASCAYENHKALKAKDLECTMLKAELSRRDQQIAELKRDMAGTQLQLEAYKAELSSTKKNVVTPKGSDFDVDKFRVVRHLNEDGSITLFK